MSDDGRPGHPDLLGLLRGELTNAEVAERGAHLDECESRRSSSSACGRARDAHVGRPSPRSQPVAELSRPRSRTSPRRRARRRARAPVAAAVALVAGIGVAVLPSLGVDRQLPGRRAPGTHPVAGSLAGSLAAPPRIPRKFLEQTVLLARARLRLGARCGWPRTATRSRCGCRPATSRRSSPGSSTTSGCSTRRRRRCSPRRGRPVGRASFRLPASLLGRYRAVDVSLEKDDGDPGHSVQLGAARLLRLAAPRPRA